jgi:hypothetical protein
MNDQEVFRKEAFTGFNPEAGNIKDVSVVRFSDCTGLLINTSAGATGALICSDLIVPHKGTFHALKPKRELSGFSGKDLDGDGRAEILMEQLALGYDDCVPGALRQYWTTIYRYDSRQGRLVDESEHFPEFYVTRVKDYRKALQEIEQTIALTPPCRRRMRSLINRAQRLAALPPSAKPVVRNEPVSSLARQGASNDFVGILSEAERRELESLLESIKKETATELVIVIIPSYKPNTSLRRYAQALMQAWEIGKANNQRGVLFILAQQEKEVWVATRPALKPRLPEETSNAMLRNLVIPSLRKGAYGRGLFDGILQIREALRKSGRRS